MEFRLYYRGELKGDGDRKHKHSLRRHLTGSWPDSGGNRHSLGAKNSPLRLPTGGSFRSQLSGRPTGSFRW